MRTRTSKIMEGVSEGRGDVKKGKTSYLMRKI
jgi:hypothetical protein